MRISLHGAYSCNAIRFCGVHVALCGGDGRMSCTSPNDVDVSAGCSQIRDEIVPERMRPCAQTKLPLAQGQHAVHQGAAHAVSVSGYEQWRVIGTRLLCFQIGED